jgi:hypothetical protein
MLQSPAALGRATALVVSVTTGVLYLILAFRLRSSGAAPEPVIVLAAIGLLTIAAGTAAPYLSVYHMYLALFFVFVPPALYILLMSNVFQFVALGTAGYLLACILVHIDESRADAEETAEAPSSGRSSLR